MSLLTPHLTPEQQEKLAKLTMHLTSLREFLGAKAGVATVVSSVSAAILIVATFNPNLLPITTGLKIGVTLLLTLIPISLLFYFLEILSAIGKTNKAIKKIIGDIKLPEDHWLESFYNKSIGYFPIIGTLILAGVIIYIVSAIWR